MRTKLTFAIVVTLLACGASAQQTPPRDAPIPTTPGTALLAGRVTTDEQTPRPIRRATVQVGGGTMRTPRYVVTDDDGRFAVPSLAPGQYSLSATKTPYLPVQYGQIRPGRGTGTPVTLVAGQRLTSIVIAMPRGAVISGTVRDAAGRPAVNSSIRLFDIRNIEGERTLVGAFPSGIGGSSQTDDRGMYRLYGIAPGEYAISATPFIGNTLDLRTTAAEEIGWSEQQVQAGRGGSAPAAGVKPPSGPMVGYSAVYYPGTADPAGAIPVTVTAGEERLGIDIALQLVPVARIDGVVRQADGRPVASIQISMVPVTPGIQLQTQMSRSTDRDGKFFFPNLTPGIYRLSARTTNQAPPPPPPVGVLFTPAPVAANLWAQADVTVAGRDVPDISMTLQPAMSVTGRIVLEGSTEPVDLTRTRVNMSLANGAGSGPLMVSQPAKPDGTFTVDSITPGRYRVSASPTPPSQNGTPWTLKSAVLGGNDVLDLGLEVRPGENVTDLAVTFTNRPAELSGMLLGADSKPASGYVLVVFSTDRAMWTLTARRSKQVRPAADGKFVVSLPAGEYYMAAVTDVTPPDLWDGKFLSELAASSFKVTLADGEKKRQDLKLAK